MTAHWDTERPFRVGSTRWRLSAPRPRDSTGRFPAMKLKSGLTLPEPMRTFAILDSGHWNLPFHVALGKVDSVAATAGKCQELQNAGLSVDIHIIHKI